MAIITSTNLKTHLGISVSTHDTVIGYAANAANAAVPAFCGRNFDKTAVASETARKYRPMLNSIGIRTPYLAVVHDFWDTTNLAIKTDETDDGTFETTWASTDYELEPLNGLVGSLSFPYYRIRAVGNRTFPMANDRAALQVTAAWGWTAVPDPVFEATLIKAARIFHRKDSPQGVAGFGEFGVVRITRAQDPDVVELLAPYVRDETMLMVA